jgi:hypothetical protein
MVREATRSGGFAHSQTVNASGIELRVYELST